MVAIEDINLHNLPFVFLANKSELPFTAGIYFVVNVDDEVLYIGKAIDIRLRWKQHHRFEQIRTEYPESRIAWLTCTEITLLNSIESELIKAWKPRLNRTRVKIRKPNKPKPSNLENCSKIDIHETLQQATLVRLVTKWRLDLLMRDRDISNEVVAKRLNVSARTVARWREAETMPKTINVDMFDVLLELLDCSRGELWDND